MTLFHSITEHLPLVGANRFKPGSLELLQVLEGPEGMRWFRLLACTPGRQAETGEGLYFTDLEGASLSVPTVPLEVFRSHDPERLCTVISALLPADATFRVRGVGTALEVTAPQVQAMVAARDAMMVNPSIDPWYQRWMEEVEEPEGASAAWVGSLERRPLFSIITPLFHTPEPFLRAALDSVLAQTYDRWELLLVNASPDDAQMQQVLEEYQDERIRMIPLAENRSIAANTNAGIREAQGDYLCFLDHDDVLSTDALAEYAKAVNAEPEIDLLYCDEDSLSADGTERFDPRFKPALNWGMLLSRNYIIHFLAVKRALVETLVLAGDEVSGAQDYDLTVKTVEKGTVRHIPKMLYHWRCHEGSSGGARQDCGKPYLEAACRRVIADHLDRTGAIGTVVPAEFFSTQYVAYDIPEDASFALAIIADSEGEGRACAESFEQCPHSGRWSVYQAPILPRRLQRRRGFAARANELVGAIDADVVVLADGGIRFSRDTALGLLCGAVLQKDTGIAAAKQLYGDGLVCQAGLCVHRNGTLGFLNQGFTGSMGGGYHGTAELMCDFSAVGPDCLAFRKEVFDQVGGFCEDYADPVVAVADFCFRVRQAGLRVLGMSHTVVTGFAPVAWPGRRFPWNDPESDDLVRLWNRWGDEFRHDVLENPHVDLSESYFHLDVSGLAPLEPAGDEN